ncbi:hypothetical protein [Paenibacillus dokdonensis]
MNHAIPVPFHMFNLESRISYNLLNITIPIAAGHFARYRIQ